MQKERLYYIDTIKGIGIMLVILQHFLQGADDFGIWISAFHMPLFFMVSGCLAAHKGKETISVKDNIKKGMKTYLYPYFSFSLIAILWFIVFSILKNAPLDNSFTEMLLQTITTYGSHAMWFLPTMFWVKILFEEIKEKKILLAVLVLCSAVLYIVRYRVEGLSFYIVNYLNRIVLATVFMLIGYYIFHKVESLSKNKQKYACLLTVSLFLLSIVFSILNGDISFLGGNIGNLFLFYCGAISGSMAIIIICMLINKKVPLVNYIGENSLIIMALHMEFPIEIGWICVGMLKLYTVFNVTFQSIAAIMVEMVICLICVEIINRRMRWLVKI